MEEAPQDNKFFCHLEEEEEEEVFHPNSQEVFHPKDRGDPETCQEAQEEEAQEEEDQEEDPHQDGCRPPDQDKNDGSRRQRLTQGLQEAPHSERGFGNLRRGVV
jgi:hypothetical protein